MISAITRFELKYHLKQPLFYILAALFFILTFFAVTSDTVQIGGAVVLAAGLFERRDASIARNGVDAQARIHQQRLDVLNELRLARPMRGWISCAFHYPAPPENRVCLLTSFDASSTR